MLWEVLWRLESRRLVVERQGGIAGKESEGVLTGLSDDLEVTCRKRREGVEDTSSLNGAVVYSDGEVWENGVGATSKSARMTRVL